MVSPKEQIVDNSSRSTRFQKVPGAIQKAAGMGIFRGMCKS